MKKEKGDWYYVIKKHDGAYYQGYVITEEIRLSAKKISPPLVFEETPEAPSDNVSGSGSGSAAGLRIIKISQENKKNSISFIFIKIT